MGQFFASAGSGYRTGALAAALALGIAMSAAPDARAAEGGWYMGLNVPVMFIDDTDSTTKGNQLSFPYTAKATTEYKAGFKIAGVLGYELGGGLRAEGELFFARAKVDKVTYDGLRLFGIPIPGKVNVPTSGSAEQLGGMANVWYDFRTGSDWTPYIGGGLGFIRVDQGGLNYDSNALLQQTLQNPALAEALQILPNAPTITPEIIQGLDVPEISASDTTLAYHLGVGVGYRLNENTTLQIGYRLQTASGLEFSGRNAQGTIDVDTDLRAHLVEIGFRTRF